ncbi:hypothetical protein ABEB36_009390 [Hypothenemus hampei]|uniref:Reverse transcriptase domain-containing protein n=1 Tax=Hypothenemus hampei TaxID=57062 RepID=A0ABD1EG77_HYPHA
MLTTRKRSILFFMNGSSHAMTTWQTRIYCHETAITTDQMPIRRGLFQGDSLSPLWFCIAMNPLSHRLNSTSYGYNIKGGNGRDFKINHTIHGRSGRKLIGATKNQLDQMLKIVEGFSVDIGMEFGLDKCRTVNIVKGQMQQCGFELQDGRYIEPMGKEDTYKYLGVKQTQRIVHGAMKAELTEEFRRRIRLLTKTKLNSKNLFKAINTFAVSVLGYSFGIIKWSNTDIANLERKVRTLLTREHKHHPRSAVERTTVPRRLGGRGLTDIAKQQDQQIRNLRRYFHMKANISELHRIICDADNFTPLLLREQRSLYTGDMRMRPTWNTSTI